MSKGFTTTLEQEKEKYRKEFELASRKMNFIEWFKFDFPNADSDQTQVFIFWLNNSDLHYKEILKKIK